MPYTLKEAADELGMTVHALRYYIYYKRTLQPKLKADDNRTWLLTDRQFAILKYQREKMISARQASFRLAKAYPERDATAWTYWLRKRIHVVKDLPPPTDTKTWWRKVETAIRKDPKCLHINPHRPQVNLYD